MDSIDLDRVRRATFVAEVDYHSEIGSTNSRALALAGDRNSLPVLVLAERQTAGRGRGSNRWWAGDGGLTLSLLLDTTAEAIPPHRWPLLSLTAGLSVAEAIVDYASRGDVRLKWPNDVLLNGRKVCGILVETVARPAGLVVLGVGLNVNNSLDQAPDEVRGRAISLADAVGANCDRTDVLISLLQSLAAHLELLRNDPERVVESWRTRCFLHGRTVQVVTGQTSHGPRGVTGVCQGIADDGALLVLTEVGIVPCRSGVVAQIQ